MVQKPNRSRIDYPDIAALYSQSQQIRRDAEIARSEYLSKLVSMAAAKIGHAFHTMGEIFSFAQRMNEKVRL